MRDVHKISSYMQILKTRKAGLILIALYLLLGLLIVKDYGMSFDEDYERETSLVAYNYVMKLENSQSEAVRKFAQSIPSLDEYPEKHGTALHMPLVAIEHFFNFELPSQTVYLMRHIFVFLNYILAAFCFHSIIWRRFPKTYMPFFGVLLFILYPRFFAEAFYNNKDILFYCWYIISVYAVLLWLEKPTPPKTLLAGAVLAFATNTRILALSILLLAIAFYAARALFVKDLSIKASSAKASSAKASSAKASSTKALSAKASSAKALSAKAETDKRKIFKILINPIILVVVFWVVFTIITPQTWKNPITGIIEIFEFFLHFSPWDGRQLYLGAWITREVPWHFIPVWISVSSPVLYIALFIMGVFAYALALARNKAKLRYILNENMYDSFFILLFWFTLLGFIVFGIYMYNGWRHAYSIFSSLLYIAVLGFSAAAAFLRERRKFVRYAATAAVAASILATTVWLIINHPYQYVYFNPLATSYAKENFDSDYWSVSGNASLNYILENDLREQITFSPPNPSTWYMLNEKDKKRIIWPDSPLSWADFHFYPDDARLDHPYSPDYVAPYIHGNIIPDIVGYQEIHAIESGGITIGRLYRNMAIDAFDDQAETKILSISSAVVGNGDYAAMFDDDIETRWTTDAPQETGDYMLIEFSDFAEYNLLRLDVGFHIFDYVMGRVLVSSDGMEWSEAEVLWRNCVDYLIASQPYKFLCFLNDEPDNNYSWSISQLRFGHVDPQWYQ